MPPGASSAGSALSAAFAGVTFATRRSSRVAADRDQVPPPPTGSDSCFGVRSLDGSMSWAQDDDPADPTGLPDVELYSGGGSSGGSTGSSAQTSDDDDLDKEYSESAETDSAHVTSDTNISSSNAVDQHIADAIGAGIHASTPALAMPIPSLDPSHTINGASRASSGSSTSTIMSIAATAPQLEKPASTPAMSPETRLTSGSGHKRAGEGGAPAPPSPALAPTPHTPARSRRDLSAIAPPPITHHALFDMLADAPSEPSSPASLASLPSCVASTSSLSRISSPADWDWRQPLSRSVATLDSHSDHDRDDHRDPHSGSAELVLPTLTLPATSLHLGLERWNGPGQGTRIALIASPERTRDVLGVLSARRACVQLPHGEIGVLATPPTSSSATDVSAHPPSIQATIVTCLTVDHIRQRVHESYTALHALFHPSTTPEQQAGLEAMVAAYANSKDWIHLTVLLDDAAEDDTLIDIVPSTTLEEEAMRIAAEAELPSSESLSPTSSMASSMSAPNRTPRSLSGESLSDLRVQNTPKPVLGALQPWPSCEAVPVTREPAHSDHHPLGESLTESQNMIPSDDPMDPVWGAVLLLERVLDDPTVTQAASAAAFFNWRPTPLPDIASPMTGHTTSPASSTFEGGGPMPTVARAQGGGEWEATLSRRLAHRRELDAAAAQRGSRQRGRGRGVRRRRSHSPPNKIPCPNPLFPRRPIASNVGLADLLDAAFAPVRRLVRTRWGQVVVACAIAVAVGCGIWAARTQAA